MKSTIKAKNKFPLLMTFQQIILFAVPTIAFFSMEGFKYHEKIEIQLHDLYITLIFWPTVLIAYIILAFVNYLILAVSNRLNIMVYNYLVLIYNAIIISLITFLSITISLNLFSDTFIDRPNQPYQEYLNTKFYTFILKSGIVIAFFLFIEIVILIKTIQNKGKA